jgi:phospholipase C
MTRNGVRWRVYHPGISFFLLFKEMEALGSEHFRSFDRFAADAYGEKDDDWPEVVIIEPVYGDVARITGQIPNDEHAPAPVGPGERLIRRVYDALAANEHTWEGTLFVISYDEHGGFFDHVPPPMIPYDPPAGADYTEGFRSLGPRVPGLIVSPLVSAGHVCHAALDHTSMLQLLAEKFTPGRPYSAAIEARRLQGIDSVSQVLNRSTARKRIPTAPAFEGKADWFVGGNPPPSTPLEHTFEEMVRYMVEVEPREMARQCPRAVEWVNSQEQWSHDG